MANSGGGGSGDTSLNRLSALASGGEDNFVSSDAPGLFTKSAYEPEVTFGQKYYTPQRGSFAYQLPGSLPPATYRELPLNFLPLSASGGKPFHGPEYRDHKRQWEILSHVRNCYEKQNNIGMRRYALKQQRAELRRKRQEVAEQGTEFISQISLLINKLDLQLENTACLKRLCEQYQDQRDWYQQLEDDYNETERSFDIAEFGLEESERVLQEMVEKSPAHDLAAVFENTVEDDASTQSTPDVKPKYHALVYNYLYQCGRADNLRDDLWELRAEHEALLNEQEMRKNYGLSLGAEALEILEDFKQDEMETLAELERTEKDARRLKLECDIQGLPIAPLPNVAYDESDESDVLISSLTDMGQLCLWRQNSPKFFEERIVKQESVNIPEFINKWFLHQLCQSSFEILRFRLSTKGQTLNFDDDRLRALIFDSWAKDMSSNASIDMVSSHSEASTQLVQVSNGVSASSGGSLFYFGQTSFQGRTFNNMPEMPKDPVLEN